MSYQALNLAGRPFVNSRPVTRLTLLLWTAGGLLLLVNAALYWSYAAGSAGKRGELAGVEARIAAESRQISDLEGELSRLNLEQVNRQIAFLNRRIAERTFGWSRLFDRLAEVLPIEVRIQSLSPVNITPQGEGKRAVAKMQERFALNIVGTAQSDEALLRFVDALFHHPAFADPDLRRESHESGTQLRFDLAVTYLPQAADAGAPAPAPPNGGAP